MSYLETLMRYKQWANQLLFSSLREMPKKELIAPRSIVFGSMIRTLNHTYAMDLVWQAHLESRSHGFTTRNPDDCPDLEDLSIRQQAIDDWYISYAGDLAEDEADQMISFTFIGGNTCKMSRRDILIHVVNHGTYHRGNVTGMMYGTSVIPPTTDYPVFLNSAMLQ